jgi:hypothetical protein
MGRRMFIMMAVFFAALASSSVMAALSPGLATVLGAAEASYPVRITAVKGLGKSLSAEEITALYDFLNRKAGEDKARPGELNAIKNDVVNALKMQQAVPRELAGRLVAMYNDRTHDEVWRDYCIQHLGDFYTQIEDEEGRERARRAIWSSVNERQGSIPGTGLIALFNVCGQKGFEKDRITAKALELVRSPEYGEPAKITALQICAKLGEMAVLPYARKLAASGEVPVRMSAMACLGMLGDKSDLELLKKSEISTDIRLRTVAQAAISRLKARE